MHDSTSYKQLTRDKREVISALLAQLAQGVEKAEIARRVGCHRSTVGREIKRGSRFVEIENLYSLKVKPIDLQLKLQRKPRHKIPEQKRKYGKSIEERLKIVETREEFGHWEGDSIIGKGQNGHILTLIERKQRVYILKQFYTTQNCCTCNFN